MATISNAWNIATGALKADQAALNVVANNVANANTPGYTREAPNWAENSSVVLSGQSYGMGAAVTGISSQRDRVLEQTLQQQAQQQQSTSTRLAALQNIEAIFNTSATNNASTANPGGIDAAMTQFFNSLSSLESNPGDNTLRQVVLSAAGEMSNSFQSALASMSQQQRSLDEQSTTVISQVNALTQTIAALNLQIETNSPTGDAGGLEDQRQLDLTQLSQLIGVHLVTTDNNGLAVTTANGATLVAGGQSFALTGSPSGAITHIYDAAGNDLTTQLARGGGQLGGLLMARDQDIPQVESALDALAYGLASQINTIQDQGADANGNPGSDFFSIITPTPATPGTAAASLAVMIQDPSKIAAAGYTTTQVVPNTIPPTYVPLGPSDGSNLLQMANVQNQACVSLAAGGFLTVSTATSPNSFYSDFTTALGALVSQTSTLSTAQQASLTQLQNQRNALSTVDLNEEASAMTALQRSYQAASKVFSILDSIMSAALNLGMQTTVS
jgi:flagellar hook-associated protein 1